MAPFGGRAIEVVVVGLHLRWAGVWQRPNHLLGRLGKQVPVIVVEEELQAARDALHARQTDGVTVMTPERVRPQAGVDVATLAAVRRIVAGRSALLWLYTPLMLDLSDALPEAPIVYDKMDELAAFKGADGSLAALEDRLCARAAYVFAGGRSLWAGIRDRVRDGGAFPSGVDADAYAAAARRAREAVDSPAGRPVFGYIGVIDERLDLALIAYVAKQRSDAALLIAGPVAKIDPIELPQAANIEYMGRLAYDELPALVACFTVALMPFALNEATRYISPTKTLEYLAAQRPVVSTAVPDVVADFGEIVYIASDAPGFVAALAIAERGDERRRSAGDARAAAMTWDAVAAGMFAALRAAGIRIGDA